NGDKYVGEFRNDKFHGQGTYIRAYGQDEAGVWENGTFKHARKVTPTVTAEKTPEPPSQIRKENERLHREYSRLKKEKNGEPIPKKTVKKTMPKAPSKTGTSGSGFFVSKLGHIITNEHVVRNCSSITVGDDAKKQVVTTLLETDKRNDLALLKITSTQMASAATKSLITKLGLKLVPKASEGLLRSDDVELGEDVLVSGYPYGDIYSNTIKVTKGIVSANRGMGDDSGQFQIDAAVQSGSSGGPIYDENGNIVGVVVSQLNKLKVAKAIGSFPENVNFGIKASTVRQFLTSSGLPTKWSNRSQRMNTKKLAKIAKNQTVMVVCNP
ncbi:MAG: trypsin-like serine protease, partial [Rhodospirillaceae bacterium]|nr:trypsin-like serine protease [Rhodospirillaceae bacterium]